MKNHVSKDNVQGSVFGNLSCVLSYYRRISAHNQVLLQTEDKLCPCKGELRVVRGFMKMTGSSEGSGQRLLHDRSN